MTRRHFLLCRGCRARVFIRRENKFFDGEEERCARCGAINEIVADADGACVELVVNGEG